MGDGKGIAQVRLQVQFQDDKDRGKVWRGVVFHTKTDTVEDMASVLATLHRCGYVCGDEGGEVKSRKGMVNMKMYCNNCGCVYVTNKRNQRFCCNKCLYLFYERSRKRGWPQVR